MRLTALVLFLLALSVTPAPAQEAGLEELLSSLAGEDREEADEARDGIARSWDQWSAEARRRIERAASGSPQGAADRARVILRLEGAFQEVERTMFDVDDCGCPVLDPNDVDSRCLPGLTRRYFAREDLDPTMANIHDDRLCDFLLATGDAHALRALLVLESAAPGKDSRERASSLVDSILATRGTVEEDVRERFREMLPDLAADGRWEVRLGAVRHISSVVRPEKEVPDEKRYVQALTGRFSDEDPGVRAAAIRSLMAFDSSAWGCVVFEKKTDFRMSFVKDDLLRLLGDGSADVREAALLALGRTGDPSALEGIERCLAREPLGEIDALLQAIVGLTSKDDAPDPLQVDGFFERVLAGERVEIRRNALRVIARGVSAGLVKLRRGPVEKILSLLEGDALSDGEKRELLDAFLGYQTRREDSLEDLFGELRDSCSDGD